MTTFLSRLLALMAVALLASGLARAEEHAGHQMSSEMNHAMAGVQAANAWVRAVPPASRMSAAYMVLENGGATDDRLLSVASDVAEAVELHNVRSKEGMMEMYRVDGVDVPAKGMVELKPGAYHIMLIGLVHPLKEGEMVTLTLNFQHAGAVTVTAPVKAGGEMAGHGMRDHMSH